MSYKDTNIDGYPKKKVLCWVWEVGFGTKGEWVLAEYCPFWQTFLKRGFDGFDQHFTQSHYLYKPLPKPKDVE